MTTNQSAHQAAVETALARARGEPGPLLIVLHAVQAELGYIPEDVIAPIAEALNLSRAEVHGVISFYHYFRRHPAGRCTIEVCRAEACQALGGAALEAHAKARLGVDYHGTTGDGRYSLEAVYCLGNCATGPSLRAGGRLYGRVTPERFDEIVAAEPRP